MSPYGALLSLRRRCYESGLFRSERSPVPAISIGNLTWGGTGKTPVALWLAAQFAASGRRVGIVSRGYGRRSRGLRIVSDGTGLSSGVEEAGDEPTLLARRLPGSIVIVAENRIEGARKAAELGAELLLLDDAFQHLALRRDLDLVLLDCADPLAGGLPPFGRSREPASALSRADVVLLMECAPETSERAESLVRRWSATAEIFHGDVRFSGWFGPEGEPIAHGRVAGAVAIAVASIARPERFRRTMENAGVRPSAFFRFRDHHFYSAADLRRIESAARRLGATMLLTTEKDLVKLRGRTAFPVAAARIEPSLREPGLVERVRAILAERGHVV